MAKNETKNDRLIAGRSSRRAIIFTLLTGIAVCIVISSMLTVAPQNQEPINTLGETPRLGSIRQRQAVERGGGTVDRVPRSLWAILERDQELFFESFTYPSRVTGSGSSFWQVNREVQFWIQTLSATDPEKVLKAIEVIELAAEIDFRELEGTDGQLRANPSYLERQSLGMRAALDVAFHEVVGSRMGLNAAFEMHDLTVNDKDKVDALFNNLAYQGDTDDRMILEGAFQILDVFVPRLDSSDPDTASRAKKVIDMFTYNIFNEADSAWWNSTIQKMKEDG